MTKGQEDLICHRIQRASETLEEAHLMLGSGHLYGASNRIYYACFYATVALLLTKDLSSSKHSGVVALFNRHFVKEGTISVPMGKFYSRMFDNRLESDYGDLVELNEVDIRANLETAEVFIKQIKALLPSV